MGRFHWAAAHVAAAAMTASVLTTAHPATAQQDAGADQALIDKGKANYAEKCSHCHGPGMLNAGTITPDLRKFSGDKERFFTTVKQGKNGKMPPWGDLLNDDQIASLWAYISSQRKP
ncbi:c-type cytochrome [Bradyrhizobium canariense]|uniref:Cytochrome c, mono-and diheme variants n=1 Tax=Bradyrhizobium canariense TaxID=255045 RepID=A0A1H1UJU3_9BRAD|nr:cytochrome c [Bradyrhizobium canariense]SDS72814.1 Cytochrome c, mono-and diheme variants [Bradyrhizobium canariense]